MAATPAQLKALLEELNAVLAEMGVLEAEAGSEGEGEVVANPEMVEEKSKELEALAERADALRNKIERAEKVAAKVAAARAVADRCTPAPVAEDKEDRAVSKPIIYSALPGAGRLRCFKGQNAEERAYRVGMWYRGFLFGDNEARRWCRDHGVESRAQSGSNETLGGALLAEEVVNQVIALVEDYGTFPRFARNVTMGSDSMVIPRRTGGLAANWVSENGTISDTDASWNRVALNAKKLAVSNRMSSEIMEDSIINLADFITEEFARAIAYKIDMAGWLGDGNPSGSHGGILGVVPAIEDVEDNLGLISAAAGNTGAETLDLSDFISLTGKLPMYARNNAAWYCSPAVYASSIQRLAMAAGGVSAAEVSQGVGLRFLGYPVNLVHVLDSEIGTDPGKTKVLFGDLAAGCIFGQRRTITVKTSDHRYAELDQTLMVATTRCDVKVHDCGSDEEVGPFVALQTAAT